MSASRLRPAPARAAAAFGCLVLAVAGGLGAQGNGGGGGRSQSPAPPSLAVSTPSDEARLDLGSVLSDPETREALQSGLPIRIRIVTELWRDQFFDRQVGSSESSWTVIHEPLTDRYRLLLPEDSVPRASIVGLSELEAEIEVSYAPPPPPRREGSYYYLATVEVASLSLSDLEELQRWLRGDLAPALSGPGEVDEALSRGLGRLVGRVLGLPTRRLRIRTPTLRIPG